MSGANPNHQAELLPSCGTERNLMADNYFSDQIKAGKLHGWHVYVIAEDGNEFSKIGTAFNLTYRLAGLKNGNPRPLRIARSWHLDSREAAYAVEKVALATCAGRLPGRDWLDCAPEIAIAAVETAISNARAKLRKAA